MQRRYRTEILIPPDRYIALQLPPHLPEGRAFVTVWVESPEDPADHPPDLDSDREDIEWWDDLDGSGNEPDPPAPPEDEG